MQTATVAQKKEISEFLKSQGEDVKVPCQYKRLDTSDCTIIIEALVHYKHALERELAAVTSAHEVLSKKLLQLNEKIEALRKE